MGQDSSKAKVPVKKRGVSIDFSPVRRATPRPVPRRVTEEERTRHEIARAEVQRREEIHRQIEAQNEAEIIARRRAEAARRELARKRAVEEEAARARAEKEAKRAEVMRIEREKARRAERLEREAAEERRKLVAARRAEAAKRELARRQAAAAEMKRRAVRPPVTPVGSVDPLAHAAETAPRRVHTEVITASREITVKTDPSNRRVYAKAGRVITRAEQEYRALHPELMGDIDDFASEVEDLNAEPKDEQPTAREDHPARDDRATHEDRPVREDRSVREDRADDVDDIFNEFDDLDTKEEPAKKADEDASANNSSYILGGRSPFINTDRIVKRPLSGNTAGIGADQLQRPGYRLGKPLLGGPRQGDYVSPAEPRHKAPAEPEIDDEPAAHDDIPTKVSGSRYVPYEEPIPHKNLYARRVAAAKKEKTDVPTMVVADSDRASALTLAIVIGLTVIVGAGVGVIAYLAFFQ